MTRTDIMADWERAEELAALMIQHGIDRRKVDAWLTTLAEFLTMRLERLESAS